MLKVYTYGLRFVTKYGLIIGCRHLRSAMSRYHPGPSASRGQKLACMASYTLFAFTTVPRGSHTSPLHQGTSWGRSRDGSAPLRKGLSVKMQVSYEVIGIDICWKVWSMFMLYLSIISNKHVGQRDDYKCKTRKKINITTPFLISLLLVLKSLRWHI
jgi:hypothetical protein